jgi:hypothetical protein
MISLGTIIAGIFAFGIMYAIFGALMWMGMCVGIIYFLVTHDVNPGIAIVAAFMFIVMALGHE